MDGGRALMKINILLKNIVLILILFIMGIVFTISLKSFYKANIIELLSNDIYKINTTHCLQNDNTQLEDLLRISNNSFISKTLSENTRAIYFSSKYNYSLPVIEGRFFKYDDFEKSNNYIVIGKSLKKYLYDRDNKTYYNYFGTEYEVIGVLGFDFSTKIDDIILFNLINVFDIAPNNTEVVIGVNYSTAIDNIEKLGLSKNIDVFDIPYTGVSRIWSSSKIYVLIYHSVYILGIISIFFLIYLKSYYYREYIDVFKVLGFRKLFFYRYILMFESIIYCIALYFGIVISLIYFVEHYYINREFIELLMDFTFINLCLFLFFNFLVFKRKLKSSKGWN